MKENDSLNLLNCIYKTCDMGIIGINDIIEKVESRELKEFLSEQCREYADLKNESEDLYLAYGNKEKELSGVVKASSKVMSNMKLVMEDKDSMIAKMMMEGTNKGIIKINKALNEYAGEDKELIDLANKLLNLLDKNIEKLKIYL